MFFQGLPEHKDSGGRNKEAIRMRRLTALLLTLALIAGLVPAAFAADVYTLDIYWIANKDDPEIRKGVEEAINEYLARVHKADRTVKKMAVSFHLIDWDHWDDVAIGHAPAPETPATATDQEQAAEGSADPGIVSLMADGKIDLLFTADWKGYVQEIEAKKLTPLADQLEIDGRGILESLSPDFLEGVKYYGQIYGVPTNKEICVPTGLIVNKTAAALIGWDPVENPVKSTEELEPYLAAYKKLFPGRYPYLMENGRWPDEPWDHDWIGLEEDVLAMKLSADNETVYSIFETQEQEDHIRLMYRWAQLGYISPDAADYKYNEIFGTGDFLVFTQPLKGHTIKSAEMYASNKKTYVPDFECVEITLQDKYIVTSQAGGSMFAVPKTGRVDLAVQYLNLMHTDPTLVNLMLFGVEGVNYTRVNDRQVELAEDANWYGLHGGAWTVGNTELQYVLTSEDPDKNRLLREYADEEPKAVRTVSYGFRFNKSKAQEQVDAVTLAVKKYARNLMVGAVDPDDPERGLAAFRKALKEAGIDELKAEVEKQYEHWKIDAKK